MKLKVSVIKDFILAYLCAFFTIIIFYNINGVSNGTYIISFIDALLKTLTMIIVIEITGDTLKKQCLTGAAVFLIVTVLYNQNSICKYAVDSLYDGSISDNVLRFFGSCYINIIIIVGALLWNEYHRKNKEFNYDSGNKFVRQLKINKLLLWMIVIVYFLIETFIIISSTSSRGISRFMSTVLSAFEYITYTVITINVVKRNGKYVLSSLLPVCFVGVFLFFVTMFTGSKQAFIRSGIVIVLSLVFQRKLSFRLTKFFLYVSPFLLQGITSLSEMVSGRFLEYLDYWTLRYHVFRYDLSDLAITFANNSNRIQYQLGVVKEAFLYSLPKFIYGNKMEVLPVYNASVKSVGLEGYPMDYNDTIFSIGGQIGGYIGIFLAFIVFLLFCEWLSKRLISIRAVGPAILMSFFGYFSYVESDLFMLAYNTRDLIVYFAISIIIFRIAIKRKNIK